MIVMQKFSLRFVGEDFEENTLDVEEYLPAVIAITSVVKRLYNFQAPVRKELKIAVAATKEGSFEIDLGLSTLSAATALFDAHISPLQAVKMFLDLIKYAKSFSSSRSASDINLSVPGNNNFIFILKDASVQTDLTKVVRAFHNHGIEGIEVKEGQNIEKIDRDFVSGFKLLIKEQDETSQTREITVGVGSIKVPLKLNRVDSYTNQGITFKAIMRDAEFVARTVLGMAIGKNDKFTIILRTSRTDDFDETHEVIKIIDHLPGEEGQEEMELN
jgi:hypothetical protein